MTTTDTVLLTVLTVILGLFFLLWCVAIVFFIKLLNSVREIVLKAESVIDSVEEAADVFRHAQGKLAFLKLISNIIKLAQKRRT